MFVTAKRTKNLFLVAGLLLLPSCSTSGASSDGPTAGTSRSSGVLTAEDLASEPGLNALQAVERLRPTWLRIRGQISTGSTRSQGVRLYMDGNPRGYAEDLAGILVSDILEMRFLDSREATTRYGTGYPDGVIVITTRRR